jgi:hypothetical protein
MSLRFVVLVTRNQSVGRPSGVPEEEGATPLAPAKTPRAAQPRVANGQIREKLQPPLAVSRSGGFDEGEACVEARH